MNSLPHYNVNPHVGSLHLDKKSAVCNNILVNLALFSLRCGTVFPCINRVGRDVSCRSHVGGKLDMYWVVFINLNKIECSAHARSHWRWQKSNSWRSAHCQSIPDSTDDCGLECLASQTRSIITLVDNVNLFSSVTLNTPTLLSLNKLKVI